MFIPVLIDDEEYLIRFIFNEDYKGGTKLKETDIFLDTRGQGVSLQRHKYISLNACKKIAKAQIINKIFKGFLCFKKSTFDNTVLEHRQSRPDFHSEIRYTPIDTNNAYIISNIHEICPDHDGMPCHADMVHVNPGVQLEGEGGNSSIKQFSRRLVKASCIKHDLDPNADDFSLAV